MNKIEHTGNTMNALKFQGYLDDISRSDGLVHIAGWAFARQAESLKLPEKLLLVEGGSLLSETGPTVYRDDVVSHFALPSEIGACGFSFALADSRPDRDPFNFLSVDAKFEGIDELFGIEGPFGRILPEDLTDKIPHYSDKNIVISR